MRHSAVLAVVTLVAQSSGGREEEGGCNDDGDEGQAEEEERVVCKVAAVGGANAFAEGRSGARGGTERIGLERWHDRRVLRRCF